MDHSPYSHHHDFMQRAVDIAKQNSTPFGAAVAMGDSLVACTPNRVDERHDPTAHAEVEAIREACKLTRSTDLSGFTLYTTMEPCPMCASAAVWSGLDAIYFGLTIEEISSYLPQIHITGKQVVNAGFKDIELHPGFMEEECRKLLQSLI